MDGLFASFTILFFTIPSLLFILTGTFWLIKKNKKSGKYTVMMGVIGLGIPWIIFYSSELEGQYKYIGEYYTTDRYDNQIKIDLRRNGDFQIEISPCMTDTIIGSWEYIDEFASILVYVKEYDVDFYIYDNDEIMLTSDIFSDCCDLTELLCDEI